MKYLLITLTTLFMSCDTSEEANQQGALIGTWQLTEVVSGWTNTITPASELGYQEYYQFIGDSAVRKYRSSGEEAIATYSLHEKPDGTYVEIIYNEETSLKETCGENEFLRIEGNQLKGGSLPCDGPGLNYEKIEEGND